jgi:hypothetical protein
MLSQRFFAVIYLALRWYGEGYLQGIITDDIRVEEIAR